MERTFQIEFPDECGPFWMNRDNLLLCINTYCENKDGRIRVMDVTEPVLEKDRQYSTLRELLGEAENTLERCKLATVELYDVAKVLDLLQIREVTLKLNEDIITLLARIAKEKEKE